MYPRSLLPFLLAALSVIDNSRVSGFSFSSRTLSARSLSSHTTVQKQRAKSINEIGHRNFISTCHFAVDKDSVTDTEGGKAMQPDGAVALQKLEAELEEEEDYVRSIKRTLLWVAAAVAFGAGLSYLDSPTTSEEFFAGYLLEQSLSIDNLLVFLLLFDYFRIPLAYQNRVLNWGILGAIVMRAIMIGAGAVAIQEFHAVLLVFAAVLIYSSAKVLLGGDDEEEEDFSENMVVKFSKNLFQSTNKFDGDRFFTEENGIRLATPMFLCMVAVELSDVVFAVDSIPAVFGVTEVSIPCVCISTSSVRFVRT